MKNLPTKNIGALDQILRLITGLILIYIGFIDHSLIKDALSSNIIGIIGILNLVTAAIAFCPLYTLANINTRENLDN